MTRSGGAILMRKRHLSFSSCFESSFNESLDKSNETVYDSQPLTQPAVSSQDILEREHSNHEESMELKAWLQPLDNGLDRIEIFDSSVVIGRSDEEPLVDYSLNRLRRTAPALWATLSRRHFSIERRAEGNFLTDLSRNGTFVNRELVGNGKTKEIFHHDVISMGHVSFFAYMFEESRSEKDLPPAFYEKYLITGTVLGTGGYGKVVLGKVRKSAARWVAIKTLAKTKFSATASRSAADSKDIKNEITCMQAIDHPNCIRIEEFVETAQHAFIILEYVDGGELYDRIVEDKRCGAGLGESLTKFYALQIFRALEYYVDHERTSFPQWSTIVLWMSDSIFEQTCLEELNESLDRLGTVEDAETEDGEPLRKTRVVQTAATVKTAASVNSTDVRVIKANGRTRNISSTSSSSTMYNGSKAEQKARVIHDTLRYVVACCNVEPKVYGEVFLKKMLKRLRKNGICLREAGLIKNLRTRSDQYEKIICEKFPNFSWPKKKNKGSA